MVLKFLSSKGQENSIEFFQIADLHEFAVSQPVSFKELEVDLWIAALDSNFMKDGTDVFLL